MVSSLFSSATGLRALGEGMASIGNNLANTNTVGFKAQMMLYQDLISDTVNSASSNFMTNLSQRGLGVSVETNRTMFQQGSFEPGNDPMDMGISGLGFFGVMKDGLLEYSRAGNFRFTKEGDLIDPNGFNLMGNRVENGKVSQISEPIKLDLSDDGQGYMQPKATQSITMMENLGSVEDKTLNADNPFFSLASAWDGTQDPPLSSAAYSHASPITVYDSAGNPQTVTAYFDYVGNFEGRNVYEYVIGMPPGADGSSRAGKASTGVLAAGTVSFAPEGGIMDMTMFSAPAGDHKDLSAWTPASFNDAGIPNFAANFAGAGEQTISLDFGLEMNGAWSSSYASAADVAANPSGLYTGPGKAPAAVHSTSYKGGSANISQSQDGYAPGYLTKLEVDREGFVVGHYSNNQSNELFRIPLYRFTSQDGLRREGGNHYSATLDSGNIESGFPTTENYGSIYGQQLEQSNVDLAREFTSMIMTQRGFQMNSKVVTTSDAMLQRALELKR